MKTFFLILFLLIYTPVFASDWTKADTAREVAWEVLHLVDWGQTLDIARNPQRFYEINPTLGRHPSVGKVNLYMGAWAVAHPVVSYILPKKYRLYWQWGTIFVTTGCVINNQIIGVRFKL